MKGYKDKGKSIYCVLNVYICLTYKKKNSFTSQFNILLCRQIPILLVVADQFSLYVKVCMCGKITAEMKFEK